MGIMCGHTTTTTTTTITNSPTKLEIRTVKLTRLTSQNNKVRRTLFAVRITREVPSPHRIQHQAGPYRNI